MSLRGAVGLLCAMHAVAVTASCTRTPMPAETSAGLCSNELDDDGDDLDDCSDPDCWGHELCRVPSLGPVLPPPYRAPFEPPPTPPKDGEPMPPIDMFDAGMPPLEPADAGGPKTPDAEVMPSPCGADCPEGACSDAGVCETEPSVLGVFVVRSIEVDVPRGHSLGADACYDDQCGFSLPRDFCDCPPDPQVKVSVDGAPIESLMEIDSDSAVWAELAIELVLSEGSLIALDVFDNDEGNAEAPAFEPIFHCELVASRALLASGRLACADEAVFPTGPRRRVVAHIEQLVTPEE
jgi:hypothetical protein